MAFLSTTFRWRSTHDVSHSALQREDGAYLSLALGTGNLISATHIFDAIDVCGNKNQIALNTIMSAQESAIHLDDTCTNSGNNNQVLANNINETCVGVLSGPATTRQQGQRQLHFQCGRYQRVGLQRELHAAAKPRYEFSRRRPRDGGNLARILERVA